MEVSTEGALARSQARGGGSGGILPWENKKKKMVQFGTLLSIFQQ